MNQNIIETVFDIPNVESNYQMVATKGNHKRIYQFKDYIVMSKTYVYLQEQGWTIKISIN